MSEQALDMDAVQHFAFKVVGDVTAQQMGPLSTVGDRLGLFTTLAASGPLTSADFATRAGINERYGREWLSAMACHGYITYDDATKRFRMTPEQAFVLANPESPLYLIGALVMAQPYWANIDLLAAAFQQGGGVPQERFGEHFWCGFERFSYTFFRNSLVQEWIPAMPAVEARLRDGGTVADVGCGNGQALIILAKAFPQSTFVGYDSYPAAIAAANKNAQAAGVSDRVRYEVCDVTQGIPGTYDLITTYDVVHDMPHPRPALGAIKAALNPGGTYFVLEFNFFGDLQQNIDHPLGIGAFGYSASTNYCMTQALAVGGDGTGTCMGEAKMRELAAEAGFTHFQRRDFPSNPFNIFYELRV
ncbi:MAG: methyltransferase domain-containing protein [Ktedonobacterales bacterium]|nr:methyltransferase domain-containing protein [Ktedonobacterales bacterium]